MSQPCTNNNNKNKNNNNNNNNKCLYSLSTALAKLRVLEHCDSWVSLPINHAVIADPGITLPPPPPPPPHHLPTFLLTYPQA
jgi:hypothetical protein